MRRQLVVVVHGVGVREAGASTDMVAGALAAVAGGDGARFTPHSSDDFHLHEIDRHDRGGIRRSFPARIRRYRCRDPQDPGQLRAERVLADFYWGDIAATGADLPRLLLGSVRIVLGLSHAIRESASEGFPEESHADALGRRLATAAALALHGPILAINLLLLLGFAGFLAALHLPLEAGLAERWVGPVAGALAVGVALVFLPGAQSYLERFTWAWLMGAGLAAAALALAGRLGLGPATLQAQAEWLLRAMAGLWALAFAAALAAGAMALRRRRQAPDLPPSLVVPAFGLMSVLWFVTISAVWALALQAAPGVIPEGAASRLEPLDETVRSALWGAALAVVTLALLAAAGVAVHLGKRRALRRLPADLAAVPPGELEALAERWRLILAPVLAGLLAAFVLGAAGASLAVLGADRIAGAGFDPVPLRAGLEAATAVALAVLAVLAGAALVWLRAPVAQGLAIVADIVVWLNDYAWRTTPRSLPPRTQASVPSPWLQRVLGMGGAGAARGYWPRQRIRDRLLVLIETLIRDENPDEIVLLSHSQGTMIAMDGIELAGQAWRRRDGGERRLTLVTMGSPRRHLYGHYFPRAWPAPQTRRAPRLGPPAEGGLVDDWLNIWRIDDFVGTRLGPPGAAWPREHPVAPRGHTNYWLDPAVFVELARALELKGPPAPRIARAPSRRPAPAATS